jgi:hypothetical protein
MKYKTFRNLVSVGGGALLISICGLSSCLLGNKSSQGERRVDNPPPIASSSPNAAQSPANSTGRSPDQQVVEFLNRQPNATGDKIKDAFPRESFKVNIYRDGSSPTWTRLKIDLDRDEKDDEKWTLANGQPDKRQVSTRDDGNYDREYRWRGAQWVEKK